MDFIKRNKSTIIAIIIFLILIVLAVQIKNIFFPSEGKALYGNRLDGIENVKITDNKKSSTKDTLTEDGMVSKASVRLSGKIIEVSITVNDDVSVKSAKSLSNKVLESLSDKEKEYYDIQVFITKENETSDFPIIGYKHHSKNEFSWTQDRTGSE